MKRGLPGILAVLAIFMVVAAGCGGSGNSTNSAETAASGNQVRKEKYRFLWKATQVCKRGLERADVVMHKAAGEPTPHPPSSAPDWESVNLPLRVVIPVFRQIAAELEELEPDKGDAYDYGNFLQRLRDDLKQVEKNPGRPISSRPFSDAGKVAYVWGLHACLF